MFYITQPPSGDNGDDHHKRSSSKRKSKRDKKKKRDKDRDKDKQRRRSRKDKDRHNNNIDEDDMIGNIVSPNPNPTRGPQSRENDNRERNEISYTAPEVYNNNNNNSGIRKFEAQNSLIFENEMDNNDIDDRHNYIHREPPQHNINNNTCYNTSNPYQYNQPHSLPTLP